jgi:radical SAM protein with 4Fe4S-binding SPASM domain
MIGELDGDAWIRILQEARQLGAFELNISGGEPTLHRDFVRIAEYIASVPTFNANLNTNGVLLRPEHEDVIVRAFSSIQVSIDNAVAEKHDAFRGRKGSFRRSIETIARLIAHGAEVNIGFTLTRENFDAVDGMVELAEQLGVAILNIGFVANIGRANINALVQPLDPSSAHEDSFIERMYEKMKELAGRTSRVRLLLPFRIPDNDVLLESQEKRFICDGDNTQILYVMANGSIMPCDKLPIELFSYGNVKESPLLDVWISQRMQAFKLMSARQLSRCRNCPYLNVCGGACVARAYQMGGSLESPDWISCAMARKFFQDNAAQK